MFLRHPARIPTESRHRVGNGPVKPLQRPEGPIVIRGIRLSFMGRTLRESVPSR